MPYDMLSGMFQAYDMKFRQRLARQQAERQEAHRIVNEQIALAEEQRRADEYQRLKDESERLRPLADAQNAAKMAEAKDALAALTPGTPQWTRRQLELASKARTAYLNNQQTEAQTEDIRQRTEQDRDKPKRDLYGKVMGDTQRYGGFYGPYMAAGEQIEPGFAQWFTQAMLPGVLAQQGRVPSMFDRTPQGPAPAPPMPAQAPPSPAKAPSAGNPLDQYLSVGNILGNQQQIVDQVLAEQGIPPTQPSPAPQPQQQGPSWLPPGMTPEQAQQMVAAAPTMPMMKAEAQIDYNAERIKLQQQALRFRVEAEAARNRMKARIEDRMDRAAKSLQEHRNKIIELRKQKGAGGRGLPIGDKAIMQQWRNIMTAWKMDAAIIKGDVDSAQFVARASARAATAAKAEADEAQAHYDALAGQKGNSITLGNGTSVNVDDGYLALQRANVAAKRAAANRAMADAQADQQRVEKYQEVWKTWRSSDGVLETQGGTPLILGTGRASAPPNADALRRSAESKGFRLQPRRGKGLFGG